MSLDHSTLVCAECAKDAFEATGAWQHGRLSDLQNARPCSCGRGYNNGHGLPYPANHQPKVAR